MKASKLLENDSTSLERRNIVRPLGIAQGRGWFALMQKVNQAKSERKKLYPLKKARDSLRQRVSLLRELDRSLAKEMSRISKRG